MNVNDLPTSARRDYQLAREAGQTVTQELVEKLPGSRCQDCGDTGQITLRFYEENAYGLPDNERLIGRQSYPCPTCQDLAQQIENLWKGSGLERHERTWRISFISGMPGKKVAYLAAQEKLNQIPAPRGWVTFFDECGQGKTGLLKSMVAEFIHAGVPAVYIGALNILTKIRATFGKEGNETEEQIIKQLGDIPFLAIDEIDRISSSDWAMGTLCSLLDIRYTKRFSLATTLATNQDPEHLGSGWEYLASRMMDGERVPVGGKSLRGHQEHFS
jgi:DNA replication protein DnaC